MNEDAVFVIVVVAVSSDVVALFDDKGSPTTLRRGALRNDATGRPGSDHEQVELFEHR